MKISFKLSQLYDVLEEYESLFELAEPITTEELNNDALVVSPYRIVVPSLQASFRSGDWYTKNNEADDLDSDDEWEPQCSVYVHYDEKETDVNKFLSFSSCTLVQLLSEINKTLISCANDLGDPECYIDTKEFIDEKTAKKLFPDNWKDEVKKKYPEFFAAIAKEKYTIRKAPPYDAEVILGREWPHMRVDLGSTFWFNHCWNYTLNLGKEYNHQESYERIIKLVSGILSNNLCMVYIFADGMTAGELQIPAEKIEIMTQNEILEYLEQSGLQKRSIDDCRIEIRIQYWDPSKDITYKFQH